MPRHPILLRTTALLGFAVVAAMPAMAQIAHVSGDNPAGGHSANLLGTQAFEISAGVMAVAASDINVSTLAVSDLSGGPFWPGGPRPVTPGTFTWPGGATSAGIQGPANPRYDASFGKGYDGVARLLINTPVGSFGCTAALIDSRHILSAGHCVSPLALGAAPTSVTVSFLNGSGGVTNHTVTAANIHVMPGYSGSVVDERDLSILTLSEDAESWIPRYRIYTANPLFKPVYEVGFGSTGNGVTGAIFTNQFDAVPIRRVGMNRFDLTRDANFIYIGDTPSTNILVADFDGADPGGTYAVPRLGVTGWATRSAFQNDRDCRIWDGRGVDPDLLAKVCNEGFGLDEVLTGSGDSGGPAFIKGANGHLYLAGVTSFGNVQCVPDQRLGPTGAPSPRTDAGCPSGFVLYGSRFGMTSGHVFAGGETQSQFIEQYAPQAFAPEPGTWALMATGLGLIGGIARRNRRRDG